MSHYFTNDNHAHDYRTIKYEINNTTYTFKTDAGVFSRDSVDYGTDLLIKTLIDDAPESDSFIDMGTGYGVVSVVIADQLDSASTAVDVNLNALALTRENAKNRDVIAVPRDKYDGLDVTADLYITNPPFRAGKSVVLEIIEDAYSRLVDNGVFYMVVQKKQGMPSYKKVIEETFGNVTVPAKSKGYYILSAIKK